MSIAARGLRYARTGSIADVLKLESFDCINKFINRDVTVKMTHAPIHRTDAAVINGTAFPPQINGSPSADLFPKIAGVEGLGTVVDAGKSTRFKDGDRVYVSPTGGSGTWATHVAVDANHVHALPAVANANLDLAANTMCLLMAHNLVHGARLQAGDTIVQTGGSSLSSAASSLFAKNRKLGMITAVTPGERFAAASDRHAKLGSKVVEFTAKGGKEARNLCKSDARLLLDGVGGPLFNEFLKTVGPNGSVVCYGAQHGYGVMFANTQHIYRNLTQKGFYFPTYFGGLSVQDRDARIADVLAEVFADGKVHVDYPITSVKLDGFEAAWDHQYVHGGKSVLKFE